MTPDYLPEKCCQSFIARARVQIGLRFIRWAMETAMSITFSIVPECHPAAIYLRGRRCIMRRMLHESITKSAYEARPDGEPRRR